MDDKELADEICRRLNTLISDNEVRSDVADLICSRVRASLSSQKVMTTTDAHAVGVLGLLNGVIAKGDMQKQSLRIIAVFTPNYLCADVFLTRFEVRPSLPEEVDLGGWAEVSITHKVKP